MSRDRRKTIIDRTHPQVSLSRQCALLEISRASVYYRPAPTRAEDLELMGLMDRQYLKTPFYGSRRMKAWLLQEGYPSAGSGGPLVSRNRVRRLMRLMGLEAIYRRPRTSQPEPGHRVYPYLLKGVEVNRVNQVWATDITYIPMARGFLYLVAIMDWYSRYVLAWKLSNTLDTDFCLAALKEALGKGRPEIFNTDQGSQFTSEAFTGMLLERGIQVSMDGKGRYTDNIFVERLWRSIKYEEVYLKAYQNGSEARTGIGSYLEFYNQQRPHQALDYRTPAEMYLSEQVGKHAAAHEAGLPSMVMIPSVTRAGVSLNLALRLSK
jgi:putative transposase